MRSPRRLFLQARHSLRADCAGENVEPVCKNEKHLSGNILLETFISGKKVAGAAINKSEHALHPMSRRWAQWCTALRMAFPRPAQQGKVCWYYSASMLSEESSVCVPKLTDENLGRAILFLFLSHFTCFYFTLFIFGCTQFVFPIAFGKAGLLPLLQKQCHFMLNYWLSFFEVMTFLNQAHHWFIAQMMHLL